MAKHLTKKIYQRALLLAMVLCLLMFGGGATVYALSAADRDAINGPWVNWLLNDGSASSCSTATVSQDLSSGIPEPYATLFKKAAQTYNINPNFLAAIFMDENGNVWKPFDTKWASSPAGATGPFQFLPSTWNSYKVDGDNDGVMDINNISDASFATASWISQAGLSGGLGDINKPFASTTTLLYFAASYNWGPGNVQQHTTPDSPLSVAPKETQNYLNNTYSLITSDFTKSGNPSYGDPKSQSGLGASGGVASSACVVGQGASAIVQTAILFSWPERSPESIAKIPKPEYKAALDKYNPSAPYAGADCGAFVGTVMHATGADPNYPLSFTPNQAKYVLAHPEKYNVQYEVTNTADLRPGDILILNAGSYIDASGYHVGNGADGAGHTVIWVGPQPPNGYDQASASGNSRMANLGPTQLQDPLNRGIYMRARLK